MEKVKYKNKLRFIDLFSGIGGFHQMMKKHGGELLFASEIDPHAIATYDKNYLRKNQTSANDVTKINEKEIDDFDVLCAGFPCQAFSKAGKRMGFEDKTKGTLFFDVLRIAKYKKPKYLMLENVRNLVSHDNGDTWLVIKESLIDAGYVISEEPIIISPHHLKIPQLRERVFIPGYYDPKNAGKKWIKVKVPNVQRDSVKAKTIIDDKEDENKTLKLTSYEKMILDAWDEFYKNIDLNVIGFPIWARELNELRVPNDLPSWKQTIIQKNRDLYIRNKKFIDQWIKKWGVLTPKFTPTHTKMEWQAGESISSLYEGIIQFRPSGVRIKRPTVFPTLVAMVQTPIIGWKKRYLSVREAAALQSFPKSFKLDERDAEAYKQFGNSINVKVADFVFKELIKQTEI